MDPSLLREREAYRKRAANAPLVEARKKPVEQEPSKSRPPSKKMKPDREKLVPKSDFDYKTATGASRYKFAVLMKIVKHLRTLHQSGVQEPITIDDILDETNQTDIAPRDKNWLITEALLQNPKIEVVDGCFRYKPILNIRDKKGLISLLKDHERNVSGPVVMESIEESVPNAPKVMKDLKDSVIHVTRAADKKEVIFFNNKTDYVPGGFDEDMMKTWRCVSMDGSDDRKLEEFLKKHNITAVENVEIKKAQIQKKKSSSKRPRAFKSHNEHMGDILKDYSKK